jgi:hypothetical protein
MTWWVGTLKSLRPHLQGIGQDPRLEAKDRLPHHALQDGDVELRGELARKRRQAEVENALREQRVGLGFVAERLHRVEERAQVP